MRWALRSGIEDLQPWFERQSFRQRRLETSQLCLCHPQPRLKYSQSRSAPRSVADKRALTWRWALCAAGGQKLAVGILMYNGLHFGSCCSDRHLMQIADLQEAFVCRRGRLTRSGKTNWIGKDSEIYLQSRETRSSPIIPQSSYSANLSVRKTDGKLHMQPDCRIQEGRVSSCFSARSVCVQWVFGQGNRGIAIVMRAIREKEIDISPLFCSWHPVYFLTLPWFPFGPDRMSSSIQRSVSKEKSNVEWPSMILNDVFPLFGQIYSKWNATTMSQFPSTYRKSKIACKHEQCKTIQ